MNNDLISVVVPCYNVEKYLEKCVESIINQTYQNLEIILVDDGATDRTPELCDKLALIDSRIKVIHKSNCGVSEARNTGIESANGKYITFFDSDDWVEPDTIKFAFEKMTDNNFDFIIWGYSADFVDNEEKLINNRICALKGVCECGGNADILFQKCALGLLGYTWNKLYKTEIIKSNKLYFDKNLSLYEDLVFNSYYIKHCQTIRFIDYVGNHYIQRNRVTLGTKRYENIFELKIIGCTARENVLKHFGFNEKNLSNVMGSFYYGALNAAVHTVATEPGVNRADLIKKMKAFLNNKETQYIAKKAMKSTLKQRVIVILVRLKLAAVLVKMKK